jgi:hypothetical protein
MYACNIHTCRHTHTHTHARTHTHTHTHTSDKAALALYSLLILGRGTTTTQHDQPSITSCLNTMYTSSWECHQTPHTLRSRHQPRRLVPAQQRTKTWLNTCGKRVREKTVQQAPESVAERRRCQPRPNVTSLSLSHSLFLSLLPSGSGPSFCDSTALTRPGGDWLGVVVYYDTGLNTSYDMMLGSIYLSDQDTKTLHLNPKPSTLNPTKP